MHMFICTGRYTYIFIYVSRVYLFVCIKCIPLEITVCCILKNRLQFDIKSEEMNFFIPSNSHKASQADITKPQGQQ